MHILEFINEIYAVYVALRFWENYLSDKRILIYCDNESVIQVVNSGKSRDQTMLHFARQIAMICAFNNAEIRLVYIDTKSNELSVCRRNIEPRYEQHFNHLISKYDLTCTECSVNNCITEDYYDT